jgi:hypothetical protein
LHHSRFECVDDPGEKVRAVSKPYTANTGEVVMWVTEERNTEPPSNRAAYDDSTSASKLERSVFFEQIKALREPFW